MTKFDLLGGYCCQLHALHNAGLPGRTVTLASANDVENLFVLKSAERRF